MMQIEDPDSHLNETEHLACNEMETSCIYSIYDSQEHQLIDYDFISGYSFRRETSYN